MIIMSKWQNPWRWCWLERCMLFCFCVLFSCNFCWYNFICRFICYLESRNLFQIYLFQLLSLENICVSTLKKALNPSYAAIIFYCNFWEYNYITLFIPFFLQTLPCISSPYFLPILGLFFFVVNVHIIVLIHKYINTICLIFIVLLACMF